MADPRGAGTMPAHLFESVLRQHAGRLSDVDLFWLAARFAGGGGGAAGTAAARAAYGPFAEWCRAPPRPPDHPPRIIGTVRWRAASTSILVRFRVYPIPMPPNPPSRTTTAHAAELVCCCPADLCWQPLVTVNPVACALSW